MRKKMLIFITIALFVIVGGFFLLRINAVYGSHPPMVYESHTTVVEATMTDFLLRYSENQLPKQEADLAMLYARNNNVQDVALTEVVDLQVENAVLQNTVPIMLAVFDDDPIYGLKADLLITYEDGTKARLAWESWRYGIVLGSNVLSLGNGPPGYITAVTSLD